jgi:hypothetical protein
MSGASHQLLEAILVQPDPLAMEAHLDIDGSLPKQLQVHSASGALHEVKSTKLFLLLGSELLCLLKRQPVLLFDLLPREVLLFLIRGFLELVSHRSLLS